MFNIIAIDRYQEIDNINNIIELIQLQFNSYGVSKDIKAINDSLKNALTPGKRSILFLIKNSDNLAIGFAFGNISSGLESGGDYLWLNELYIDSKYRNKGIGKELILYIEKWCKIKNIKYICCTTGLKNSIAQKFYQSLSFELCDTIWVDKSI